MRYFWLGFCSALALSTVATGAELNKAKVTQIIHDVNLLSGHAPPRPATVSDEVREGTAVRTGNDSRAELTFSDLTITRMGANTVFSFNDAARQVNLDSGAVLLSIPRNAAPAHVNTAAATAAVSGGTAVADFHEAFRFYVVEGQGVVTSKKYPNESITLKAGETITVDVNGHLGSVNHFDVARMVKSGQLFTAFGPLPNADLIQVVVEQQGVEGQGAAGSATTMDWSDLVDITDQSTTANEANASTSPISTSTPPVTSPTPSKVGPPQTITSPDPYVISSGTQIQTDPAITTNGVTAFGTIYRNPSQDGPFSSWAFGSTSSFDTNSGFDALFTNGGAVFKFANLQLTGDPTISTTNGETSLGLIAVNSITSGAPGGSLTFSGISGLLLATQAGSITLGSEISFSGIPHIEMYARGAGSNLTVNSGISGTTSVHFFSEGNIQLNGQEHVNNFHAVAGGTFNTGATADIDADNIDIAAGTLNFATQNFAPAEHFALSINLNANTALNIDTSNNAAVFNHAGDVNLAAPTINLAGSNTLIFANNSQVVFNAGSGGIQGPNVGLTGNNSNISLTSAGDINIGSILSFNGANDDLEGTVSAGGSLHVSDSVVTGTISVGQDATAGGRIHARDFTVGGSLTATNDIQVFGGSLLIGDNLTSTSGSISLAVDGNNNFGNITVGGNIVAGGGLFTPGNPEVVLAGGSISAAAVITGTLQAGGDISIDNSANNFSFGIIANTITAGGGQLPFAAGTLTLKNVPTISPNNASSTGHDGSTFDGFNMQVGAISSTGPKYPVLSSNGGDAKPNFSNSKPGNGGFIFLGINTGGLTIGAGQNLDSIVANGGAYNAAGPFGGGDGGTIFMGVTKDVTVSAPNNGGPAISATTGIVSDDTSQDAGTGGTVKITASGSINIGGAVVVSSDDARNNSAPAPGRESATGGTIALLSNLTTGSGITISSNGELLSLLVTNAPGPGGSITLSTRGSNILVQGTLEADAGTITMDQNDPAGAPTPLITLDGADLISNTLTINGAGDVNVGASMATSLLAPNITIHAANDLNWNTDFATVQFNLNNITITGDHALNFTGGNANSAGQFNVHLASNSTITAGAGGINAQNVDFNSSGAELNMISAGSITAHTISSDGVAQGTIAANGGALTLGGNLTNGDVSALTDIDIAGDVIVASMNAGGTINCGGQLGAFFAISAGSTITGDTVEVSEGGITTPANVFAGSGGVIPFVVNPGGAAQQNFISANTVISPNGIDFSGDQFAGIGGLSSGGILTLNVTSQVFDPSSGVGNVNFNGADAGATNFEGGTVFTNVGGDGGKFIVNATGDITVSANSTISATTGQNDPNLSSASTSGAGGTVQLNSTSGTVSVDSTILVSSAEPTGTAAPYRASSSGGNITLQTGTTTGTGINIGSGGQLLSLLRSDAPGPGGSIVLSTMGSDIVVNGTVEADRGTITMDQNDPAGASTPSITMDGATLIADSLTITGIGDITMGPNNPVTLRVSALSIAVPGSIQMTINGASLATLSAVTQGGDLGVHVTNSLTLNGSAVFQTNVAAGTTTDGANVSLAVDGGYTNNSNTDFSLLQVHNQGHIGTGGNLTVNIANDLIATGPGSPAFPEPGDFEMIVQNTNAQIDNGGNLNLTVGGNVQVNGLLLYVQNWDGTSNPAGHIGNGGNIDVEVTGDVTANSYVDVFLNNRGGGSIGSGGNLTFNVTGNLNTGSQAAEFIVSSRYDDSGGSTTPSSIGSNVQLLLHAANIDMPGGLFGSGISNRGGSTINGNATVTWDVPGDVHVGSVSSAGVAWFLLNDVSTGNQTPPSGGTIHGNAALNLNLGGNLTIDDDDTIAIQNQVNPNSVGSTRGGIIDGSATLHLAANNVSVAGEFDVNLLNQNGVGNTAGAGGHIGGDASINLNLSGALSVAGPDATDPGDLNLELFNHSGVANLPGGFIGGNASINLSALSVSTAGALSVDLDNHGGGFVGQNATIVFDTSGAGVSSTTATLEINNPNGGIVRSGASISLDIKGKFSTTKGDLDLFVFNQGGTIGITNVNAPAANASITSTSQDLSSAGVLDAQIDNDGGVITGNASVNISAAAASSSGNFSNTISNGGGGSIGGAATVDFTADSLSAGGQLLASIFNGGDRIGSLARVALNTSSDVTAGSVVLQLDNGGGGSIQSTAAVTLTVAGNLTTSGDAALTIANASGSIGDNTLVSVTVGPQNSVPFPVQEPGAPTSGNISTGSGFNTTIDNTGGTINGNATVAVSATGNVSAGDVTVQLLNSTGSTPVAGSVAGNARISFFIGANLMANSFTAVVNDRDGGMIQGNATAGVDIFNALTTTTDLTIGLSTSNRGNGGGTIDGNGQVSLTAGRVGVTGFVDAFVAANGGGTINGDASLDLTISGDLSGGAGILASIEDTGFGADGSTVIGAPKINGNASISINANNIVTTSNATGVPGTDLMALEASIYSNVDGTVSGDANVSVAATQNITAPGTALFWIANGNYQNLGIGTIGGSAGVSITAANISTGEFDLEILNFGGASIGKNAALTLNAATLTSTGAFNALIDNTGGGRIHSGADITLNLDGALTAAQIELSLSNEGGTVGFSPAGVNGLPADASITSTTGDLISNGAIVAVISNDNGGRITGNASVNVSAQKVSTGTTDLNIAISNTGGTIDRNASVSFTANDDTSATGNSFVQIVNGVSANTGASSVIGGDATVTVQLANFAGTSNLVVDLDNTASSIHGNAMIDFLASGNVDAHDGFFSEILNSVTDGGTIAGTIGGSATVDVASRGVVTASFADYLIQNQGGQIGGDATISVAPNGANMSGTMLVSIDNTGGTIGGNATINMDVTNTASVGGDVSVHIIGNDAKTAAINFNGGTYDVGGTLISSIDGNGTITFDTVTAHADVVRAAVFGSNGTLRIGGGSISANTILHLYATGGNGTLDFFRDVTLSSGTLMNLAGKTITIEQGVTVTIAGNGGPAHIYTDNPNYNFTPGPNYTGPAPNTSNGSFAGNGATDPQPTASAPPFGGSAGAPVHPVVSRKGGRARAGGGTASVTRSNTVRAATLRTNAARTAAARTNSTTVRVPDSGKVLSMLDDATPRAGGKLVVTASVAAATAHHLNNTANPGVRSTVAARAVAENARQPHLPTTRSQFQ
jgi:filamentous hemagglutinin